MFGKGVSAIGIFMMDYFRTETGSMTLFLLVFVTLNLLSLLFALLLKEEGLIARRI